MDLHYFFSFTSKNLESVLFVPNPHPKCLWLGYNQEAKPENLRIVYPKCITQ